MTPLTFEEEQLLCYVREHSQEIRKALVLMILDSRQPLPTEPLYHLYLLLEEMN